MRILITGGAGFIGSQLGLYLDEKKHQVIPLDNLKFGYLYNFAGDKKLLSNFIRMDIRDPKLEKVMKRVDIVFHIAAIISLPGCNEDPQEAYYTNVAGTANVLEMSRRTGVKKVIFASTSAIYENETEIPFRESINPQPTLIYAQTKKAAEEICKSYMRMYGMDITILRFFNVYGPHMDYRPPSYLISYIIGCLLRKETPILHSNGKQARDFVYVSDAVKICEIVITHPKAKNGIFNVGSGKAISIEEVFNIIADNLEEEQIRPIFRDPKLIWERFPKIFDGKYPLNPYILENEVNKYTISSTKKTKKMLNWEAKVDIKEGLNKTIAYIKNKEVK